MKQLIKFLVLGFGITFCSAQKNVESDGQAKLVVGIIVDQMRYDYLTRFYNKYGDGGFKRMMNEGFNCKNNHYNYVPTATGPGHTSVFTGTTPKYHGIIGNDWYDKTIKKEVYCAEDDSVNPVGSGSDDDKMSPHRMMVTTFADENKLFTQMRGKSIGIAIKDRGAIMPVGHTGDAAYWFHGSGIGKWVTSSYYMQDLPQWVKTFNSRKNIDSYLKTWNTLYDINTYTESGSDLNDFENGFKGKETATFPYDLKALKDQNWGYSIIKSSPFGNSLTTDFALAAVDGEKLGQDDITDVLTISYSSTDYAGHNFGVNSKEIEDMYIRLDKDLERLFIALDNKVGAGNYTVFLTADHGAVDVPSYLESVRIPGGDINSEEAKERFGKFMMTQFGTMELIEDISNSQVFLNKEKIRAMKLDLGHVQEIIADELIDYPSVYKVYTAKAIHNSDFSGGIEELLQNGYNQKRSGDVIIVHSPTVVPYSKKGSSHGSGYVYDTHVPLLFFGHGIKHGETVKKTRITDIAPTISAMLGIAFPNAATGQPLEFVLD